MARGGTPAIVALDAAGVSYRVHEFDAEPTKHGFGQAAAVALGVELERVFKTLIATVDDHQHVVAIVPVSGQLSLKELAAAVHGKRAEMCPPETAERLTGYVVGGISPFGQKRALAVVIDETCVLFDTIFVSGGRRGLDIEIAPDDLVAVLHADTAPIGNDS
ncbi:MAG: Cys-tRNA(Pro)/Cys-tRNA(Cys) deacylase [Ilumatobacteraceae bacterium]